MIDALLRARIHIAGIVQGVGFRPFVFSLASRIGVPGWVRNTSAGIDIEVDGSRQRLDMFIQSLKEEAPLLSRIDVIKYFFDEPGGFIDFQIIDSEPEEGAFQPVSPDICICDDCLRELFDIRGRRYLYPFINCTNCGPRFTIIKRVPYDRPNTTMASFSMCPDCEREYQNPLDRRFHAQPIACPVCGPKVWLEAPGKERGLTYEGNEAIQKAQQALTNGRILAIKGLGGFHLSCDATDSQAVKELRELKLRVDKPFALMLPNIETIKEHCYVNTEEEELLFSRQRPIVLLKRRKASSICLDVAPRQDTLGVMLPYTPLHYLLFHTMKKSLPALVMTSGNISEEPIAYDNDEARDRLSTLADVFLMHNRDIYTRCDDSVVRVPAVRNSRTAKKMYFLRRSRGYAPDSLFLPFASPSILATGSELKNTFCLARENYAFISHHIGDMENYETLKAFETGIDFFECLFNTHPEAIACDMHPDYLSTIFAHQRAVKEGIPMLPVQHHHAHIASCMADNNMNSNSIVIGIAFDGTGFGEDGSIWGGEILISDYVNYKRRFHLEYFPLPGSDAAIKFPIRTALALLWSMKLEWNEELVSINEISKRERNALHTQLERKINAPNTSSMGRLFDAVAALTGVRQKVNYEAQAAIEFESLIDNNEKGAYSFDIQKETISSKPVITEILNDISRRIPVSIISGRFHNGIVKMVREVCFKIQNETDIKDVVLSGGVWQNMVLLDRTVQGLRSDGFQVHIHKQVPTNDGGISLGQVVIGAARILQLKSII